MGRYDKPSDQPIEKEKLKQYVEPTEVQIYIDPMGPLWKIQVKRKRDEMGQAHFLPVSNHNLVSVLPAPCFGNSRDLRISEPLLEGGGYNEKRLGKGGQGLPGKREDAE